MKASKLLCMFAALLLLAQTASAQSGAAAETAAAGTLSAEADAVLSYILKDDALMTDMAAPITRAEFAGVFVKALKAGQSGAPTGFYADVSADHPYADAVYAARSLGWVSPAESFSPGIPILREEAVKIAVSAMGFAPAAREAGGYPAGYWQVAAANRLLPGTGGQEEAFSRAHALMLIYNTLQTDIGFRGHQAGYNIYRKNGETLLNDLYGIYPLRGKVTATSYTSYKPGVRVAKEPYLEIDGEGYGFDGETINLFWKEVTAFVLPEEKRIVALAERKYEEAFIELAAYQDVINHQLRYWPEDGRESFHSLSPQCLVVFNQRAVSGFDKSLLQGDAGTIRLLDNNGDGLFDALFADSYAYLVLEGYDEEKITLADANDAANSVEIRSGETLLTLTDSDGLALEVDMLVKGQVLAVARSTDGAVVRISVREQSVVGTLTTLSKDDKRVHLDGTEYRLSDYALRHYDALLQVGRKYSFGLGLRGEVVSVISLGSEFSYGYLIDAMTIGSVNAEASIKIFTQSGRIETLPAKSVTFDSERTKLTGNDIITKLRGEAAEVPEMLIRYRLGGDGYLTHIDLAATDFDFLQDEEPPQEDSLRKFSFGTNSFRYRTTPRSCAPYFNLAGTVVFKVPAKAKAASARDFFVRDSDSLQNDLTYTFDVYDLQKTGSAGVVVERYTPGTDGFTPGDRSYIVERVVDAILPDGSFGKMITCYTNGAFHRVFLPDNIQAAKDSGTGLLPGDIIEVKLDAENVITELLVDLDAASPVPVRNSFSKVSADTNNTKNYQLGSVYSNTDTYVYLSNQPASGGGFVYDFASLKNFSIATSNIVKINRERTEVRPMTVAELKSYVSCGTDCHYLVIRQSTQAPQMIFVYE